jgi:hypothetical protein
MYDLQIITAENGPVKFTEPNTIVKDTANILQRVILVVMNEDSKIKVGILGSALELALEEERLRVLELLRPSIPELSDITFELNGSKLSISVSTDYAQLDAAINI